MSDTELFINIVEFAGLSLLSLLLVSVLGMIVLERLIGPRKCDLCTKEMDNPRYKR